MTFLRRWRRLFGSMQLSTIEKLLIKAISNQEKLIRMIEDADAAQIKALKEKIKRFDG